VKDFYEDYDDLIPFLPKNIISVLLSNGNNTENSFLLLFTVAEN
jgi:hypothetical protein